MAVAWVVLGAAPRVEADLADDLARINVEETGGTTAHIALQSFQAEGLTQVGTREVQFVLFTARPRSVRIEALGKKQSLVRAFDGVHAPWRKDDPAKPPLRLGRDEEREFLLDSDFDSPLFNYKARQISLDYAGEVVIEGKTYQTLLATVRFTDVLTLYIDDETKLLVRRDRTTRREGRDVVTETHFSDFKKVNGVRLPRRIRTLEEGRLLHETIIKHYEANPRLPIDFFAPPARDWPKL